jgi:hypothetical protein
MAIAAVEARRWSREEYERLAASVFIPLTD